MTNEQQSCNLRPNFAMMSADSSDKSSFGHLMSGQVRACSSCNLTSSEHNQDQNQLDACPRRIFRQVDYYDATLVGLSPEVDKLVELHKQETMIYNRGKFVNLERNAPLQLSSF